ncbi:MAG: PspC domain-containing protein [Candidatus Cloacimonadota bacterium]|nr:PspC domain-containing protein [Candidatus Cloacimonadota bacterium]
MKKLHISKKNKVIAGVCGGLAESLGINANIVRAIFGLSLFFGGSGLFVYILLLIILPKDENYEEKEIIDVESETKSGKIYRSWDNKMIAGVCAGIADYLKWDVSLVRIIFVILALSGGIGAILYIIFWFLFPMKGEEIEEEE